MAVNTKLANTGSVHARHELLLASILKSCGDLYN